MKYRKKPVVIEAFRFYIDPMPAVNAQSNADVEEARTYK